jgi:hypothetical protein
LAASVSKRRFYRAEKWEYYGLSFLAGLVVSNK